MYYRILKYISLHYINNIHKRVIVDYIINKLIYHIKFFTNQNNRKIYYIQLLSYFIIVLLCVYNFKKK